MSYALLHCHSQFSLLEGLAEPEDIVAKCKEAGITAVALTDIGSVSGIPQFLKAAKKNGIKPILGCELFISDYEGTVNVLALNKDGWKKIIGLISFLHTNNEKSQGQLSISMDNLKQFISDDLLCLMGAPRTVLYTQLFHTSEFTTQQLDEEDLKLNYLHTNWINNSWEVIQKFQALFGQKNVYLEALATDGRSGFDMALRSVRYLGKKYNIPVVASTDSRYCNKQDAADFRTMLCIGMECTLDAAEQTIVRKSRWELVPFFDSFNYYIHTREQLEGKNTPEELDETLKLAERVQEFDIIPQQQIPTFPCPNNMSADDYLLQLCREGWAKRKIPLDKKQEYGERVKKEFDTFSKAGLSSYFLIVADYVNAAKQRGELIGAARGCLDSSCVIYTLDGPKNISDISVGEHVYDIGGKLRRVNHTHKYSISNESLLKIRTKYGDYKGLTLTKDHKVLVVKGSRPKNWDNWSESTKKASKSINEPKLDLEWIKAQNITSLDWLVTPIPTIKTHNKKRLDLSVMSNGTNMVHDKVYCYHYIINPLTGTKKLLYKYNRYIDLDKDFYKMLGVFVGDGWLTRHKNHLISFVFNIKDKKEILWMKKFFARYNITYKKRTYNNIEQIFFSCKHLRYIFSVWFAEYKYAAHTKYVPDIVMSAKNDYIKSFLDGYKEADGSDNGKRITYTTVSKKLAYQIKFLLLRLGLPSAIRHENRTDNRKEFKNSRESYYISYPKRQTHHLGYRRIQNYILTRVRSIKEAKNIDYVYDLTIDDEHNYLTSNGVVHNSAAGCLISYLLGITEVDPMPYNLVFERFYNEGRNTKDHISMPDIDIDFPSFKRDNTFSYIRQKYGEDKVAQVITFIRGKGRGILKDVLRVSGRCDFELMNKMTENVPDEAAISDKLQEMEELTGSSSIIRWALENDEEAFADWVKIKEDGSLDGEYAQEFAKAIRLEGMRKAYGKHAAGLIISNSVLDDIAPIFLDKSGKNKIIAFEYKILEELGFLKVDILSVTLLDKLMGVNKILAGGDFEDE